MLYRLLRRIAHVALRWYYRSIEVDGHERIPTGGPVILANGSVAGMTVCGLHLPPEELEAESPGKQSATPKGSFKPTISGVQIQAGDFREAIRANVQELIKQSRDQNMAVPLERLLAFLHQNGIHPDPGPTTKEWREALAHYRRGEYREAASKLESVSNRQIHFPRPVQAFKLQPTSITSHYVAELRDAAKYKAGNKP